MLGDGYDCRALTQAPRNALSPSIFFISSLFCFGMSRKTARIKGGRRKTIRFNHPLVLEVGLGWKGGIVGGKKLSIGSVIVISRERVYLFSHRPLTRAGASWRMLGCYANEGGPDAPGAPPHRCKTPLLKPFPLHRKTPKPQLIAAEWGFLF